MFVDIKLLPISPLWAAACTAGDIFCYISNDERLGHVVCHIYQLALYDGDKLCSAIAEVRTTAVWRARRPTPTPTAA